MSILTSAIEPPNPLKTALFPTPPFWPTKLWERPIANTPRSSGHRKLIGFKQRVHSMDLPHGNWNHPGWPIFFKRTKRDVNQNNQSLRMNLYIKIYGYIHYTIERRECIDRCQYMLWHKWNKHTNYGGNATDLDHSKSISFTMCQVDGLVNQK